LIFLDAGNDTDIVVSYTDRFQNFYPIMGVRPFKDNQEKGDRDNALDKNRYRPRRIGTSTTMYSISTLYYKRAIYQRAKLERSQLGDNRAGFMDFPKDTTQEFFTQLFNERIKKDGSFWAGSRPVEALDCHVYALCACDVYLDNLVMYWREAFKKKGFTDDRVKNEINKIWVIKYLQNKTTKKIK